MANYVSDYTDDRGRVYRSSLIRSFSIVNEEFTETSLEFDRDLLPRILVDNSEPITNLRGCGTPEFPLRQALCLISDSRSYIIQCPFQGGTQEFIDFFTQLSENTNFRVVNLVGERIGLRYAFRYFR